MIGTAAQTAIFIPLRALMRTKAQPVAVLKIFGSLFVIPAAWSLTENWTIAGSPISAYGQHELAAIQAAMKAKAKAAATAAVKKGAVAAAQTSENPGILWNIYQTNKSTLSISWQAPSTPDPTKPDFYLYEEYLAAIEGVKAMAVMQTQPWYPEALRTCTYLGPTQCMPFGTLDSFTEQSIAEPHPYSLVNITFTMLDYGNNTNSAASTQAQGVNTADNFARGI